MKFDHIKFGHIKFDIIANHVKNFKLIFNSFCEDWKQVPDSLMILIKGQLKLICRFCSI